MIASTCKFRPLYGSLPLTMATACRSHPISRRGTMAVGCSSKTICQKCSTVLGRGCCVLSRWIRIDRLRGFNFWWSTVAPSWILGCWWMLVDAGGFNWNNHINKQHWHLIIYNQLRWGDRQTLQLWHSMELVGGFDLWNDWCIQVASGNHPQPSNTCIQRAQQRWSLKNLKPVY